MREIGHWFGLQSVVDAPRRVTILGCPFDGAATGPAGSADGPAAIRAATATEEAVDEYGRPVRGLGVVDLGDVEAAEASALAAIRRAADLALADADADCTLLGLGGDHAVTMPLAQAVAARQGEIAFLMLDAHADCFPDYEGRPDSHACTVARLWDSGTVKSEHTALVGLRSYATPELPAIAQAGLMVPSASWLAAGAPAVARQVLDVIGGRPLYLSIDIDVLDPAAAPGTGYPVAGGPTSRQLLDLLEIIVPASRVVGLDLVEVAPSLDATGVTAATAAHLLLQVLAALAAGGPPRTDAE
jgi:agmatinase